MIRKVKESDSQRLAELHIFGWRNAYKDFISHDFLYNIMNIEYDTKMFNKAFNEKTEETYVYEEDGEVKAFLTIGKCRDKDKPDSFELWGIYVDPSSLRQGIGYELLKFCEDEAVKRGYKEITLWTWEKNMIGRNFYEKNGYTPDGMAKGIIYFKEVEMRYVKKLFLSD